jgi:group I intron endonuclease
MPSNSKKNAISAAIRTYGKDNFIFEVIDTAQNIEELNQKEIDYIAKFDTVIPNGYNIKLGGDNYTHNSLTGAKISAAKMGHTVSEETRAKISLTLLKRNAAIRDGEFPAQEIKQLKDKIRKTQSLEDILIEEVGMPIHQFASINGLTLRQIRKSLSRGFSRLNHEIAGSRKHPEYTTWKGMIQRCYNKTGSLYPQYGEKGIRVCWRWLNSFQNFIEDMGARPEGCVLGRKDRTAWYSPENCQWITTGKQSCTRTIRKNNKGFPGVYKRGSRWRAKIGTNSKVIHLGTFGSQIEAIDCYLNKYKELHGEVPLALLALKGEIL